ncbi:hypothetical protein GCM10027570_53970 [Streptomonospora sediminis]
MATFRTGQQTHPSVPPQQLALEPDAADTPRIGHETGVERRQAPGAGHVREEPPAASPGSGGATPDPDGAGEQHREVHPHVFMLDTRHRPLQPCHPARARKLLAKGRAVVHRHTPFTIRLKDRTAQDSEIDGVELGIDPGSSHTGLAVFTNQAGERRGLDALAVGRFDTATESVARVLVASCTGRGTHARTRPDKHGFPRLAMPRTKTFFGFATGDLVTAVVPTGKNAGAHTGRVAVRSSGKFNVTTARDAVQGIHHKYIRLLQRADGYGYTIRKEGAASSPA